MIKKITKTITTTTVITTIIKEYPDTNTINFKDTIHYRTWIDVMDIFPLKDLSYSGKYESSGYDENLNVGWTRNDLGEIKHIFLTGFCNISNETFKTLEQKFPEYLYWKDLKEYQSDLINFKNSISYDKRIDTLTIRFRDINMIEYLFNNAFKVLEYYSHLDKYKTILAIVIPGFKIRNKAFIKKLSTNYPQYPYWDLIESMMRN